MCGEWLHNCVENPGGACAGTDGIILCEQFDEGNANVCVRKVDPTLALDLSGDLTTPAGLEAIASTYSKRTIGWRYGDYTGWSIPGFDPWDTFTSNKKIENLENTSPSSILCRVYPEKDSPFPIYVTKTGIVGFTRANTCKDDSDACECSYKKVEVGASPVYYGGATALDSIPNKLCTVGNTAKNFTSCGKDWQCANVESLKFVDSIDSTKSCQPTLDTCSNPVDGSKKCLSDADCNGTCSGQSIPANCVPDSAVPGDGICSTVTKVTSVEGLRDWCLEYDKSLAINGTTLGDGPPLEKNPCLTWFPYKSCVAGSGNCNSNKCSNAPSKSCETNSDCDFRGILCTKDDDCGAISGKCQ
jgi:hypothetical protein